MPSTSKERVAVPPVCDTIRAMALARIWGSTTSGWSDDSCGARASVGHGEAPGPARVPVVVRLVAEFAEHVDGEADVQRWHPHAHAQQREQ